jgi:hypothetical protein
VAVKRAAALLAAVVVTSIGLHARADDAGPMNALSVHPFSITSHGLALQYERYVVPRHWSVAFGLGGRSSSSGDYSSWETTAGIEPRYWLWGPNRSTRLGSDAMIGPFVSLRVDGAWLTMTDTTRNRWVGGNVGISLVGSFGWRFAIGHFETTPSLGLGARTDFDATGRLAPWTRYVIRVDWTAGWMF